MAELVVLWCIGVALLVVVVLFVLSLPVTTAADLRPPAMGVPEVPRSGAGVEAMAPVSAGEPAGRAASRSEGGNL